MANPRQRENNNSRRSPHPPRFPFGISSPLSENLMWLVFFSHLSASLSFWDWSLPTIPESSVGQFFSSSKFSAGVFMSFRSACWSLACGLSSARSNAFPRFPLNLSLAVSFSFSGFSPSCTSLQPTAKQIPPKLWRSQASAAARSADCSSARSGFYLAAAVHSLPCSRY